MPAKHDIDSKNNLITTTWHGEATDSEMIDAINKYQQEIKSNPDYLVYNEIVDLSEVGGRHITIGGMKTIAQIAARTDQVEIQTKLALITNPSPLTYFLARMYEAYRNLFTPNNSKAIKVFKNASDAYEWLGMNT
ncbi:MAG: hypothetical protein KAS94_07290 [Desulfobulbaceae bacterium]|nr:hypothetical protein [Desulfobulbaceae bacterium]